MELLLIFGWKHFAISRNFKNIGVGIPVNVISGRCTQKKSRVRPYYRSKFLISYFSGNFCKIEGSTRKFYIRPCGYGANNISPEVCIKCASVIWKTLLLLPDFNDILIKVKNHTSRPRSPWVQGHTYLCRVSQDEYRRDEGDCERDRSRYQLDSSISLNVFLHCLLLPSGERMIQPWKYTKKQ